MNEYNNRGIVPVVNIRDIVWDLLRQWKAILVVALLIMVFATGLKYISEYNKYKEGLAKQEEATKIATLPAEEQIEKVLSALPADQRDAVEYMVYQKEWVKTQREYLNNSILMNAEPTSQRTIILDYYIASADGSNSIATSLAYGYASYVTSDAVIDGLHEVVDPEADKKYIAELISTPLINNYDGGSSNGTAIGSDDGDFVLEVKMIAPEGVDADAVQRIITNAFADYSDDLTKVAGEHTIQLIRANEAHLYNSYAVSSMNSIIGNIYNIQNYIKNTEASLTDEQKAAIESIMTVKEAEKKIDVAEAKGSDSSNNEEELAKPGLSKKYALIGFVLGAIIYAFFYTLSIILKGRITSASQVEYYTSGRLLGDVYYTEKHSGLNSLIHSKFVDNIRFQGKLDPDEQISKIGSASRALFKHGGIDNVTILRMPDEECRTETAEKVIREIKKAGVDVTVKDVNEDTDGNSLLDVKNAIIIAGGGSTASALIGLSDLLREFDVPLLGNIYIQGV